jgi:hypothetical protein
MTVSCAVRAAPEALGLTEKALQVSYGNGSNHANNLSRVRISATSPAILLEVFRGLPRSLHTNIEIAPYIISIHYLLTILSFDTIGLE